MPLPRPCNYCEQKFKPETKTTKLCYSCYHKARTDKINRQKIERGLEYLNVSSTLPKGESDIYKLILVRTFMDEKKEYDELKIETTIELTAKEFEKFVKKNPKIFKNLKGGH